MTTIYSFGEWVKQRRNTLRYTQRAVAEQAYCSTAMVKKIEADERQPSPELAEHLARVLQIPESERDTFAACARGERPVDQMPAPDQGIDAHAVPEPTPADPLLPRAATPFIGRKWELAEIAQTLAEPGCRLMTLVGAGGAGKTRLALATAEKLREAFADGAVFVPLVAVRDAALVPDAISHTLALAPASDTARQVIRHLQRRSMLLVLDNCEQLGDGIEWLAELLSAAPGVKILATSRSRLRLAEEWLYPVPVLEQAAELFVSVARRTQPSFDDVAQRDAVDEVCRLVEGLPLAIELAASWTGVLSGEQIAENIRRDLNFLASDLRNVPERHRSLRAVIDQSWSRLAEDERRVLRRLSVFRGGWSEAAAFEVAEVSAPLLRTLVDTSLLDVSALPPPLSGNRYAMHELVRQYAAARLWEAGEEEETRQRHAEAFVQLAQRSQESLFGPDAPLMWREFDLERENFQLALEWLHTTVQTELMLRITNDLWFYWFWRGYRNEVIRWLSVAIDMAGDQESALLCMALGKITAPLIQQGRIAEAMPHHRRAFPMAQRLGDPFLIADAKVIEAMGEDNMAEVDRLFGEAIPALAARQQSQPYSSRLAAAYGLYGDRLRNVGRYADARTMYEKSLQICRDFDNRDWIVAPLGNLGRLALQDGEVTVAHDQFAKCVALARASGHQLSLADWLARLGETQLYMGEYSDAEATLHEMLEICDEMRHLWPEADVRAILAQLLLETGDIAGAQGELHTCMQINHNEYHKLRDHGTFSQFFRPELADTYHRLSMLLAAQENDKGSAIAFGIAQALGERIHHAAAPPLRQDVERVQGKIRARSMDGGHDDAVRAGRAMSAEEALSFALDSL